MNRSVLLAVAVGVGLVAMQVGSVEAKAIKGQTSSSAAVKADKHQGGHLISETVHLGPASPDKSLPPAVTRNIGNDKLNTTVFGKTPVAKLPPSWKNIGNDRNNTTVFGRTPIWGGHPPRFPPPSSNNGSNHNGCDHDGCNHYGCDRQHDCYGSCDWMFWGDMCYGDYHRKTCDDFGFEFFRW